VVVFIGAAIANNHGIWLAKVFHLFEPSRELVVFQHQFSPFLFVLAPIKLRPKPLGVSLGRITYSVL
jgi:hypothetical protein